MKQCQGHKEDIVIEREDLIGQNLSATLKVAQAGEIRCRLRPGQALDIATKAIHVTKATDLAWQGQFHCHRSQVERYLVIAGTVAVVSCRATRSGRHGVISGNIYRQHSWFSFEPGVWHDILTTPGAEFVTLAVAAVGADIEHDREVMSRLPYLVSCEMAALMGFLQDRM